MKELLYRLLFGTIGMLVVYASMSFYKLSLNPVLWAAENRFIVVLIGFIFFAILAVFPNYEFKNKK
jgi:hypothetical protein